MKTKHWKTLTFALLALAVSAVHGRPQSTHTLYAFTSFAGKPGGAGNVDGIGSAARFTLASIDTVSRSTYGPVELGVDGLGNVYVPDTANSTIR